MWGAKFVVFKLPWALETVPIALFFYFCGYMFKNYLLSEKPLPRTALVMLICFFCTAVCLDSTGLMPIPFYSILNLLCSYPMTYPGLDILLPIAGFLLVRELAVRLSKLNAMGKLFTSLGLASMVIMYLHGSVNAIAVRLVFAELSISPALRVFQILLAVFLPLGIYSVFLKFETTRKLFLGLWTAAGVAVRRQSVRYNREQQ
jgi:fucose 4-O-acetylase-like acetyltransferase